MTAQTLSWVMRRSVSARPFCGSAWWSANTRRIFAPPRPGKPSPFASGKIEIMVLVDDVERGLVRLLRIDAHLGAGAGERIDHTDHHFGRLGAGRDGSERGGGGSSKQDIPARDVHDDILCWSATIDETVDGYGKASMRGID